jgi:hypothetical protein
MLRPQQVPRQQPDMKSAFTTADFSALPSMPKGKSTILGGQITKLDPVLDQFTLRIFGQRPMKILFDGRTQVYRNGIKIPLRDLRSEEHASVQTILEGPNIFAISIHMLSDLPQGQCRGNVLDYNPGTRELTIATSMSNEPVRLLLREDTPVVREGQGAFTSRSAGEADLVNGALVSATFDAGEKGRAVANRVTVLAKPGSSFAYSGKLSSLDMHAGRIVLVDPRDQKSYQISFDPDRFPASESLHVGDQLRVSASFDGTRYVAVDITRIQAAQP